MRNNLFLRSLVLLAALAISVPTFAKPMAKNLPLTHAVRVGQVDVKAGDYRFLIDDNHLTIFNAKNTTVAESNGHWEDREKKSDYTEVVSNAEGKLLELRFAGKKSVFILE
jgi:hypothetical protein